VDNGVYHIMSEKTTSQIDTSKKVCYDCNKPAIIIINRYYYCATCGLHRQHGGILYGLAKNKR